MIIFFCFVLGVARPKAHGHATTNTEIAFCNDIGIDAPLKYQANPVAVANPRIVGTK